MGILSWLKSVTAGGSSADLIHSQPIEFARGEENFHGLNMREAIDVHLGWTQRLEAQLNGTANEKLEVGVVASDCNCALGKWLHGEGKKRYRSSSEWATLVKTHAGFHLKAGEILNNIQNGENQNTQKALKALRHMSGSVQLSLVRLYSHAQN